MAVGEITPACEGAGSVRREMMNRPHDNTPTYAFCASLLIHACAVVYLLHTYVEDLSKLLTWQPRQEVDWVVKRVVPEEVPRAVIQPYSPPLKVKEPPPIAEMQKPEPVAKKLPAPQDDQGEKGGTGVANETTPGERPMATPAKFEKDQAYTSRDPEGFGPLPEDPSMSTVPQGEGGDGRKPANDPLAGKGTDGAPAMVFGSVDRNIPDPPAVQNKTNSDANTGNQTAQIGGESTSQRPAGDKLPATPEPMPALAENNGPRTTIASAQNPSELFPIKTINPIAPPSLDPPYPDIVDALTRPPSDRISIGVPSALPEIVSAETESAPDIQPAIMAMIEIPTVRENLALNEGLGGPIDSPEVVAALLHAPGPVNAVGNQATLPDLAAPDAPGGEEVQDAITALVSQIRPAEELALQLDQPSSTALMVALPKGGVGSVSNATGGRPGAPTPAADPAPDTGSEWVPAAQIPSIEYRNGKVQARSGRQVKTVRPRLTEAGRRDLLALQFPSILLKVKTDVNGKVTDVTVIRGTGSEAIDMPVYRALWGWYFEPPKDKNGNPQPDTQLVAIHFG